MDYSIKKKIALLAGGDSGEAEISLKSASVIENNLDKDKFEVYKIFISRSGWYYLDELKNRFDIDKNDFSLWLFSGKVKFDCIFIAIHGTPGEDGKLQAYFELLNIPYTTCDSTVSSFTFNKAYCNYIVKSLGLVNISKSIHLFRERIWNIEEILRSISFPCFVKPNAGGSSVGMSKVNVQEELAPAIFRAFVEDSQILIEEFVKGREFTCGVVSLRNDIIAFPITEVISKKDFFDYEAKYTPGLSNEITPANIPDIEKDEIQRTAKKLYSTLNCKGVVRFDFIREEGTNKLYFLEVNTIPGQSENSIVPQQARAYGWTVKDLYTILIENVIR